MILVPQPRDDYQEGQLIPNGDALNRDLNCRGICEEIEHALMRDRPRK